MSKVDVVEYVERWINGGIEGYILNIIRYINRDKFNIRIVVSQKELNVYDNELKNYGIEVEQLFPNIHKNPIERTLKNQKFFKEFCKENRDINVLHLHINHGVALKYSYIAKRAGIKKVIVHCHNSDIGGGNRIIKKIGHNWGKHFFRSCPDIKIACSDLAAKWIYTKNDINSRKIKIYRCIVDIEKHKFSLSDRNNMRKKYNMIGRKIYLHVGRMCYQKNSIFLLDICKNIFDNEPDSVLFYIGTGELEQKIKSYVRMLKIKDRIIFISQTREVEKYMSMADIFLLPSIYEGNPIVGIEAQTNGLTCIFSDAITKQAKILDQTSFINLKLPANEWSDVIINSEILTEEERSAALQKALESGYDVKKQIKEIEMMYNYDI